MKKILLILIPLFYIWTVSAQSISDNLDTKVEKVKAVPIKGKIENPKGEKVVIFYNASLLGGERKTFEGKVEEDGTFEIEVKLDKSRIVTFFHGGENTSFYLTPTDETFIALNTAEFDESITYSGKGEGISASNYLAKSFLQFEDTEAMKDFRETFYNRPIPNAKQYLLSILEAREKFLLTFNEENEMSEKVQEMMRNRFAYSIMANLLSMPEYRAYMEGVSIDEIDVSPDYYDFLKKVKVNNPSAIESLEYLQFTNAFLSHQYQLARDESGENEVSIKASLISDVFTGEVKNLVTASFIMEQFQYGSFLEAEKMLFNYKKSAKEEEELPYLDMINPLYENLKPISPGNTAPAIVLKDKDGKEYSLADFKGKVVYIDFWASWCGPCRREMPYARKLQKDFANKEVVFLYISVDRNREAWLKAMEEEQLGGVHLWAEGFNTSVPESYQVKSIPNYFLIDRQGNIANNNPDRPSGKGLVKEIEVFLLEK